VPADDAEAQDVPAGNGDRALDLGVESGAIFGLYGPRGAVWASVDGRDPDAGPPERPAAA
jgi:hypothetical protein